MHQSGKVLPALGRAFQDLPSRMTRHWYRHPLQYIDSHPSPRNLILNYDDLIQRPEQVLREFYEQFGYPDKPGLEVIVDEAVKETLSFRSDHVCSYEDMGFTREQIIELYADIFERFKFDKREDEVTSMKTRTFTQRIKKQVTLEA